jgi:ABC-type polysaccharide/polyol phosphate transport system ATPase subunit
VRALQEISFKVQQGERLGVLGHNGAGKSTLLKVLAGIYPPSAGRRTVEGKICSLFDLLLGLEPEASGWENIGFRSYLQGETPRSVRAKVQEIAAFSELGDFLNMPVRFYSAGMLVRLAFSIATAIDPEVLLIDEALGAGDLGFQKKARARMIDLMQRAHLMVVVSHDLLSLGELCDRVLWMDHGRVRQIGPSGDIIAAYSASMQPLPALAA